MATTTNFGWETPDDTDLVKDGAAAIRTALGGVDTSFVDLKGGTTGQVLAKASNTDLDFTWTTDASGIPATIVDAKGDLIAATAADTVARLAVGTNGQVLTADSTAATGIKWATAAAGGMTLIATATPSAASTFSFTSIPSTYKHLLVIIPELVWSASNNWMKMRFATGSYYSARAIGNVDGGALAVGSERGETYFGQSSNSLCPVQEGYTASGVFGDISTKSEIWIYDYTNTNDRLVSWKSYGNSSTSIGQGSYDHNVAISNIDFQTTAGTVTGTAYLYGVS